MGQETKEEIKQEYQLHDKDSGSAGVQVALLTHRIDKLTEHLRENKKDHSSRYGLIKMVSARHKLLDYLQRKDQKAYRAIVKRLKLRR
ncbi:30S ribosomal protein S15 [Verrucomicrobiota bacterium]